MPYDTVSPVSAFGNSLGEAAVNASFLQTQMALNVNQIRANEFQTAQAERTLNANENNAWVSLIGNTNFR